MSERKKNLSLSCAHERGRAGTEVYPRGIRHQLGGAAGVIHVADSVTTE